MPDQPPASQPAPALRKAGRLCGLFAALLLATPGRADLQVHDASGAAVHLKAPARRIISLAPHNTENLFAAGAGDRLVGVAAFSDYPPTARALPQIGDHARFDLEAILALRPDLVVGWQGGNSPAYLERLKGLGLPVYLSAPTRPEDIAADIEKLGVLSGQAEAGQTAAQAFRQGLDSLRQTYAQRRKVRVFVAVWDRPLLTLGGRQVLTEVIRLCGGENVFAAVSALAPSVSEEAVLAADPEVIVASGPATWLEAWRNRRFLSASRREQLYAIPPDWLQRPTPRLLQGAAELCRVIERARQAAQP